MVGFHRENQKKEETREWDLNRKDILKIEPPLGSIESTLRPSSLQKFEGEDIMAADRRDLQIKQQRQWCEMQKKEKEDKKDEEEELDSDDPESSLELMEQSLPDQPDQNLSPTNASTPKA